VAFSPDGDRVLSGSQEKTIKLWDGATGTLIRTFEGHSVPVTSVAFSPDGGRALSGSWEKSIKLWDTATGALIRALCFGHFGGVLARRRPRAVGQLGQHDQALGRRHGAYLHLRGPVLLNQFGGVLDRHARARFVGQNFCNGTRETPCGAAAKTSGM
jgi:hypothetical protein